MQLYKPMKGSLLTNKYNGMSAKGFVAVALNGIESLVISWEVGRSGPVANAIVHSGNLT